MAVAANSAVTYTEFGPGTGSIREDLADTIELIDATDTPLWRNIGRGTSTAPKHEWQDQTLAAAALNQKIQGNDFVNDAPAATDRVGNYNNISIKVAQVAGTNQAADHAGKQTQMRFEIATKMQEIRRDVEVALFSNNASVVGSNTTTAASEMGGIQTWIQTNFKATTTAAAGGYVTTTGLTSARSTVTAGALTTFALADINTVMQTCFGNGARPSQMYLPAALKTAFSSFTGVVSNRRDNSGMDQATIVGGADFFISDFGPLSVIPSVFMNAASVGTDAVLLIDPERAEFVNYRTLRNMEVAKVGDYDRRALVWEYTMAVNERAHGAIWHVKP